MTSPGPQSFAVAVLLEADNIDLRYGRLYALRGVTVGIAEGEIVAVLGANGAGKSSLLRALFGLAHTDAGRVSLEGVDVSTWPPRRRLTHGLALVPEARRIVAGLTVEENLRMGAYARRDRAAVEKEIGAVYERFPDLAARRHLAAALLSAGEQQLLAINRGLLARPRLMMLDEPSRGLTPALLRDLFAYFAQLNAGGLTLLLAEQNTAKALSIAARAYVLDAGAVAMQGPAKSLLKDPRLGAASTGMARQGQPASS